jgi:hypothetical protein
MTELHSVIMPRRSLLRFIIDHNPFFLLSAVCMLAGCLALTNSLSWSPIRVQRLLMLVVTLNIYEALLIGLAIVLIAKRRLYRDGTILLMLETFFLVDVTFLNSELFAASLRIGTLVNAILLLLGIAKVTAIFVGLGISPRDGSFPLILLELTLLIAIPGVFKLISSHHSGTLPPGAIYASWWIIGIVPVIATLLLRASDGPRTGRLYTEIELPFKIETARPRADSHGNRRPFVIGLLMLLPVISLLAHVSTSNWIYHVRWYPANVTPLILGLAIALGAYDWHVTNLAARMRLQLALPILAIAMSARFPSSLEFYVAGIGISPLRLALAGATLVYAHGLWLHRHMYFAWAACTCVLTSLFGTSPQLIGENMTLVGKQTVNTGRSLIPRTLRDWGITSIGASFVSLLIGAVLSLMKESGDEPTEEPVEPG